MSSPLQLASPQGSSLDGFGIAKNSSLLARLLGFQAEIVLGFSIFSGIWFYFDRRRRQAPTLRIVACIYRSAQT